MPDEIQVFDPAALKKRVADSVTATFGMLVPESQWAAMVEREVKAFFEEPGADWIVAEKREGGYGSNSSYALQTKLTPFRRLVWDKVNELCRAQINAVIDGDKLRSYIERDMHGNVVEVQLSNWLEKKLEELAPKMAVAFFRTALGGAVEQAKTEIRNEISSGRR